MIEVRNLVKKYGNHVAVNHLNFTVEKGKIYGFLGPNGAGKSTTMNMITGYIASTEGEIMIDGHNILEEPEVAKKKIGYLPEIPPLYLDMTVQEYLSFAAELKGISKEKRKSNIEEVMSTTKVTEVKYRLIKNLSKGYRQRVGLAQALLGYPEIIILDEPTVGLDPKQIIEIRDLIKNLGRKHTVILSSHILSEVSAVCDQVLIIDKGRLVASDTPENLGKVMSGTNSLEITVKGQESEIRKALDMVENIQEVIYHDSLVKGACDFTIKLSGDMDMRENIFFALAEVKCPILKMQSSNMSLEEVFLKLTDDAEKERQVEIESEIFEVDENNQETKKTENKNEEGEA
ncbi:MAG: ABC transporter ATP-binding protein [Firmicutes bacterium]|nr:ABC transporter ATP-binding protein [Bacillota bacterium]